MKNIVKRLNAGSKKNNIRYGHLIMMNFATKEERVKSGSHGRFKAEHYKRIKNANIFIESSERQAEEIAELSGKWYSAQTRIKFMRKE